MSKWKEILSDASKFPDDFVVSLKDGQTLSLGEMRAYDVETKGAMTAHLTAKEKELATREENVNKASVAIGTVVEKVAAASGLTVEDLLQGKTPSKRTVAAAADLDENDPLVGAVVKQMKAMQAKIDAQATEVETLRKNALGPMLNTYLEDFYEGSWDKITPTLPKGAKVELKEALDYANKNGLKDPKGRLDLKKAVRDLTYDARIQEEAEKRVADLRKKDRDEQILASAPKPGGNLGAKIKTDKSLTNSKGQTKSFDEMLADAQQDTEMWKQIGQVS